MLRTRIIPSLLIQNGELVKTTLFKDPKYVGDPINAIKIFNEKEADEIFLIDIDATIKNKEPNYELIKRIAAECRMPLSYGGGIKTNDQALKLISLGVEKVIVSSAGLYNFNIFEDITNSIGSQSLAICLDVKKQDNNYEIRTHNGSKAYTKSLFSVIEKVNEINPGELVINCIDKDGTMEGFDISLAVEIKKRISIPLTMLGGCGSLEDIKKLIINCGEATGAAAGSFFVFKGKFRAVLISYPTSEQKNKFLF